MENMKKTEKWETSVFVEKSTTLGVFFFPNKVTKIEETTNWETGKEQSSVAYGLGHLMVQTQWFDPCRSIRRTIRETESVHCTQIWHLLVAAVVLSALVNPSS
eukprot:5779904-Amphidinium_carterae.1